MTILSIVTLDSETEKEYGYLTNACEFVDTPLPNEWTNIFIKNMIETAKENNLVGLAANQVGVSQRIILVDMNSRNPKTVENIAELDTIPFNFQTFINPVITHTTKEKEYNLEGCASVPNAVGKVSRYTTIKIQYSDINGESHTIDFSGWIARIFQHEIDHLDGLTFLNRTKMVRAK